MSKYESAKKKEEHAVNATAIFGALNDLSIHMRGELKDRGIRSGGTDTSWRRAAKLYSAGVEEADYKKWYLPFSMAMFPEEQSFPARLDTDGVKEWSKRLASF
jgi:hypothetical protein